MSSISPKNELISKSSLLKAGLDSKSLTALTAFFTNPADGRYFRTAYGDTRGHEINERGSGFIFIIIRPSGSCFSEA